MPPWCRNFCRVRGSRRDTVIWLCLLILLVAGVAHVRSSHSQTIPSIVASGPWKKLVWRKNARFQPVQVSSGPLLFILRGVDSATGG